VRVREARFPREILPEPGEVRLVEVGTQRVGLYRVGAEFHALADRCPHRGAPLCSGVVATPIHVDEGQLTTGEADSVVRCPWHKWEFEIASGRCVVDDRLRVRRYTVREDGDGVVVSHDAPS
jgi:3-phenylpropionate/trans-cinnamate dioxygenase ferredoxin subunit